MTRVTLHVLCLTVLVGAASLPAQSPASRPAAAPPIPATPAGKALGAWLDAFNSGDSTRLDAYFRNFEPDGSAQDELPFRARTGGFDLLTVERSEPRHLEFTVGERASTTTAYGVIEVAANVSPPRVTARNLAVLGPNASAAAMRIDAATRARVVESVSARLDSFYVTPAVATQMGDSIRARLRRGAYDDYANGMSFAMRLTDELRAISHDKHLGVDYFPRPLPPRPASPSTPSAEDRAREQQQMDRMNCGFLKAEHLPGNVGYLKFDMFADPEVCAPTATAAMTFVAGSRALILDLRENGGGNPHMVAFIASYLFDGRTHLNDLWRRRTGSTEEFWTSDSVPGRRFGGEKPVYVLTSARTFSGGEEFAYDLKSLKRATIVGETTGGGAHPVADHPIDDHFVVDVPWGQAINPVTRTSWEGVGVEPDVKVPASDALATAQRMLREHRQR